MHRCDPLARDRRRDTSCRRAAAIVRAREDRGRSCWCCSRSAPARTVIARMMPTPRRSRPRRRARHAVREDGTCRRPAAPARRWRCPARCRASCRRRSRRARAATSSAGPRTSAATSRRASCSPRSRRPRSTSSCRRRSPRASRPAEPRPGQEHGRALGGAAQEGRRLAAGTRRAAQRRRAGARQPRRRRRQRAAAAPARGLQARRRAVRRRDHAAQRRRRRPDRRRQRPAALFLLTQTDPLRVYVNVPQSYAQLVKPGRRWS